MTLATDSNETLKSDLEKVLLRLLEDDVEDVRWNAAIALTHRGSLAGDTVLTQIMNRAFQAPATMPVADLHVFQEALAASLKVSEFRERGWAEKIAQSHPNLQLRQFAKKLLQSDAH
jgi:hypothetical protein